MVTAAWAWRFGAQWADSWRPLAAARWAIVSQSV